MNLLSLDMSVASLGYVYNVGSEIVAGTIRLGSSDQPRDEKRRRVKLKRNRHQGARYIRFRGWLKALPLSLTAVALEAPYMPRGGFYATKALFGLEAFVEEWCARRRLPMPERVHIAALKKWTTGFGRASKMQMRVNIVARLQRPFRTDDEAEAMALHQRQLSRVRDASAKLGARYLRSALRRTYEWHEEKPKRRAVLTPMPPKRTAQMNAAQAWLDALEKELHGA